MNPAAYDPTPGSYGDAYITALRHANATSRPAYVAYQPDGDAYIPTADETDRRIIETVQPDEDADPRNYAPTLY